MAFALLLISGVTFAAVPQTLNIQGRLTDSTGAPVTSGDYSINFTIYSSSSGGTGLWSEVKTVTVSNSFYDIILGTTTPITLPFNNQYYMGIKVGSDSEMTPRINLTAVPYALVSYNVTCTQCLDTTQIKDIYVLNTGDSISGNINVTGVIYTNSIIVDGVNSSNSGTTTLPASNITNGTFQNNAYVFPSSLSVGSVFRVDTATGRIGIGTISPDAAFHVIGNIISTGTIFGQIASSNITGAILQSQLGGLTLPAANISGAISQNQLGGLTLPSANVTAGTLTGAFTFDSDLSIGSGGFSSGGITLKSNGDIFANGTIYVTGNLTTVDISTLNINGSLLPQLNNTFDIGNSDMRWKDLYLSGNVVTGTWQASPISQQYMGGITIPIDNVTGVIDQSRLGGLTLPAANITSKDNSLLITQSNISTGITIPIDNVTGVIAQSRLGGIIIPIDNVTGVIDQTRLGGLTLPAANITNKDNSMLITQSNISTGITIPIGNVTGVIDQSRLGGLTIPAANVSVGTLAGEFTFDSNLKVGTGGFTSGGITLESDGDIWTNGSLYITGNITTVDVTNLNVNGSLVPQINDTFDIGSLTGSRWNDIYITGNVIGGTWQGNPVSQQYMGGLTIPASNVTGLSADTTTLPASNVTAGTFPAGLFTMTSLNTTGATNLATGGGKVGIGVKSPNATLDIVGSGGSPSGSPLTPVRITSGDNTNAGLIAERTDASEFIGIWAGSNGSILGFSDTLDRLAIGTYTYENRYSTDYPTTELLTIKPSGKIGIKNRRPTETLEVNGTFLVNQSGSAGLWANGSRVGIGTTIPFGALHVQKNDATTSLGKSTASVSITNSNRGVGDLSEVNFYGYDTSSDYVMAGISANMTSTDGNTLGDLLFSTKNSISDTVLTERMRILANGNVGIGTTGPENKLHVLSSTADDGIRINVSDQSMLLHASSTRSGIGIEEAGANLWSLGSNIESDATKRDFQIREDGTNYRFVIQEGGNVGINTTNPSALLHLSTSSRSATIFADTYGTSTLSNQMRFRKYGGTIDAPTAVISGDEIGYAPWMQVYNGTALRTAGYILYSAAEDFNALQNGARVRFAAVPGGQSKTDVENFIEYSTKGQLLLQQTSGNVSIGTTSTAGKLTISTTYGLPATSGANQANNAIRIDSGLADSPVLDMGTDGGTATWIQSVKKDDLSTNKFLLLNPNGGNVGINTTTPGEVLDVVGNVIIPNNKEYRSKTSTGGTTNLIKINGSNIIQIGRLTDSIPIALHSGSSGAETMRLTGGNVGIGTASPVASLQVMNTQTDTINYDGTGANAVFGASGGYSFLQVGSYASSPYGSWIQSTNGVNANHNILLQLNGGNVGIGTTTPGSTLTVTDTGTTTAVNLSDVLYVDALNNIVSIGATPYSSIGAVLEIQKSTSNTANLSLTYYPSGTPQVLSGDVLGNLVFSGVDNNHDPGINMIGARIAAIAADDWNALNKAPTNLAFYTHGTAAGAATERMRIDSTGNVGIGITNPKGTLHLNSTGVYTSLLVEHPTLPIVTLYTDTTADTEDGASMRTTGDDSLLFSTVNAGTATYRMAINGSTGNVGIGTASPGAKLDVTDDIRVNSSRFEVISIVDENNDGFRLGTGGNTFWTISEEVTTGNYHLNNYNSTAWSTKMTIANNTGKVGIGTTAPLSTLHVKNASGDATLILEQANNDGNSAYIESRYATSYNGGRIQFDLQSGGGAHLLLQTAPDGTTAYSTRMTILSTGNVGINTTTPSQHLEVAGNIASSQIRARNASGLGIYDDGGNGLFVEDAGFVGIGNTNPSEPLDVTGGASGGIRVQNAADTRWMDFRDTSASRNWYILPLTGTKFSIQDASAGSNRLVIDSNGLVGINISTPVNNLHISGGANDPVLRWTKTGLGETATDGFVLSMWGDGGTQLWDYENQTMRFGVGNSEKLRIESTGNVGIGSTSPISRLTVTTPKTSDSWNSAVPLVNISNLDQNGGEAFALLVQGGANNGATKTFEVRDWNGDPDLVVMGDGDVGIGTGTPGSYKLNVNGTVNASAYVTNGSDYAEWYPKAYGSETLEEGDVVGIMNGKISKTFANPGRYGVITARAGFVGGKESKDSATVSFIGRVPVKITGTASEGDLLVPAGSGKARAVPKAEITLQQYVSSLGTTEESGSGMIMTAIGIK